MLSTSKIGSFTLSHGAMNEKLFKKNKLSPHLLSPLEQYKAQLATNANELKKKFPNIELQYIKSLLDELENNVEMVTDLLQQEQKKQIKNLMDQQRSQSQASVGEGRKQKMEALKIQDVKVLQKSVAKLFKKFAQQRKQKEQLLRKLAVLSKENQNLKMMNQQLLKQQMNEVNLMKNLDIC